MSPLVLGGGPAALEASRHLPGAVIVPQAWHAEPGRLWVEDRGGLRALLFDRLLVLDDVPLILAALGCTFDGGAPVVDGYGETSQPGIFAAGPALGVTGPEAPVQARIAALALAGQPAGPGIAARPRPLPAQERLDPVALAGLLEGPPGPARDDAVLAQCALIGPVAFALPVGLAALAAMAGEMPDPLPVQSDAGGLA
ncbi:hypothetical protein [Muricoccus pecuniae]|uniref:Uncharacterized protein n=1 Tax=Muricoccus pecuniae TaxID=693023 RepID=A0A840YLA6_9PROT|nr:hypothetical protein [Roseomonas pecuniae]MBB5695423.1 hypothetical protein [Roseomonas pecuniae]